MRTLTTLTLFLFIHLAQAQTNVYQPYPLDNASWTIRTIDGNTAPPVIEDWITKTWGGQITIGGVTYTEVLDDPNMVGVRQDIPNKQVFYIDDQGVEYDASFDQDVQVGDTVFLTEAFLILNMFPDAPNSGSGAGGSAVVEGIDSVLVGPTYRKRITMSADINTTGFNSADYICGVHFSETVTSISNSSLLDCFYVEGEQYFGDPSNPYCTAGIEELSEVNTQIYPNPSNDVFFIDFDQSEQLLEIHLLDLMGKRIASFDKNKASSGFDISNYPSGMYIVEAIFEKGKSQSTLLKE